MKHSFWLILLALSITALTTVQARTLEEILAAERDVQLGSSWDTFENTKLHKTINRTVLKFRALVKGLSEGIYDDPNAL